jgi:hypothetical protein
MNPATLQNAWFRAWQRGMLPSPEHMREVQSWPLREIVDRAGRMELLLCGHTVRRRLDPDGFVYKANSRHCHLCKKEDEAYAALLAGLGRA